MILSNGCSLRTSINPGLVPAQSRLNPGSIPEQCFPIIVKRANQGAISPESLFPRSGQPEMGIGSTVLSQGASLSSFPTGRSPKLSANGRGRGRPPNRTPRIGFESLLHESHLADLRPRMAAQNSRLRSRIEVQRSPIEVQQNLPHKETQSITNYGISAARLQVDTRGQLRSIFFRRTASESQSGDSLRRVQPWQAARAESTAA